MLDFDGNVMRIAFTKDQKLKNLQLKEAVSLFKKEKKAVLNEMNF
jgi:hypothetical protein